MVYALYNSTEDEITIVEEKVNKQVKGFITYSHEDASTKDELRKRLAVMEQQNELVTWDDGQLTPGDGALQEDILKKVTNSNLLLYLVSAASLASKNCNKELAEALKQEIRVIPIILEHCDWLNHQVSGFEVLPNKGKPLSNWGDPSEGWQNVVGGIRKALNEMQSQSIPSSESAQIRRLAQWVFQQGNFLLMLNQINWAIQAYSHSINLNPFFTDAYNNRGAAYGKNSNYDHAIKDFNKVIEFKPDNAQAYNIRGVAYKDKGEYEKAIADHNKAIELKPDFAWAFNYRGIAYKKKGDIDNAIEDFNKAIELKPDLLDAYNNRGMTYDKKDKFDKAIEDFNKAIELGPDLPEVYNNRGMTYGQKGDLDAAIKDFNKAIELKPDLSEAYSNRGNAYVYKGKLDTAIKDYTQAINLKPDYVVAYSNRGAAYFKKGEDGRAIENYNKAIELKPDYAATYRNRAEAWLRQQEWDKAKTDFTTAKRLGVDITAMFHNSYKDVETYEKRHRVKLPEDLALLLTQRRRDRYPKLEKIMDADGNPLESPDVVNLRQQIYHAGTPLGEYIKTKLTFGINTTPTEVFVIDKTTRNKLIAGYPSSADILKPFLYGKDLRRWHVGTPQQWLIFTHRGIAINDYPAILKYLEKHKELLSKRKGKQEWYELPASLKEAKRFTQPKLVCPNTYNHQTFAVDTAGYYYGNTSYLIPTEETWLCGLLNSRIAEWFYSQVSKQLTIDPLRARSEYIQQIPIPDVTSEQKSLIGKIVDYLIYLQQQPTINSKDLAHARDRIMLGYFERIIEGLVYEVYLYEQLHASDKHFFKPLLEEQLRPIKDIEGNKMSVCRDIFELLYERTHLIRRNLYYLDSVKSVRIIEGKL